MKLIYDALERLARDLDSLRVPWAVIGGLAVATRGEPRLTRDVDVAVSVDDDATAERIVADLVARGHTIEMVLEQTGVGRMSTVRMLRRGSRILLDLLFASSGIEQELVAAAERIEIAGGLVLPVARRPHLIALKMLARNNRRRPQDHDDIVSMTAAASPAELAQARELLGLIEERGFNRGRDLRGAFDAFLRDRQLL